MVVVVRGEARDPLGERERSATQMDPAPCPLARPEPAQQRQHLRAPSTERGERGRRVVAAVLAGPPPPARGPRGGPPPPRPPPRPGARPRPPPPADGGT